MSSITTKDGTEIFYKDWGSGQPVVFHHGWPLSSDDRDTQMLFFAQQGFRVIAHDRREHGRSTQTSGGNDMDTYAADVAALVEHLDLRNAIHVGHSTGGGEATRYVARHGAGRVAKTRSCRSRIGAHLLKAAQERDAQGLQGLPARHVHDARRRDQPGSAALHP